MRSAKPSGLRSTRPASPAGMWLCGYGDVLSPLPGSFSMYESSCYTSRRTFSKSFLISLLLETPDIELRLIIPLCLEVRFQILKGHAQAFDSLLDFDRFKILVFHNKRRHPSQV